MCVIYLNNLCSLHNQHHIINHNRRDKLKISIMENDIGKTNFSIIHQNVLTNFTALKKQQKK